MIVARISVNFNVVTRNLKKDSPALVKKGIDTCTIILNSRYNFERQQQALKYDLKHIEYKPYGLISSSLAI